MRNILSALVRADLHGLCIADSIQESYIYLGGKILPVKLFAVELDSEDARRRLPRHSHAALLRAALHRLCIADSIQESVGRMATFGGKEAIKRREQRSEENAFQVGD